MMTELELIMQIMNVLSEVTQVVVYGGPCWLSRSGNATGFRPTGVVWLKSFQRDMFARARAGGTLQQAYITLDPAG